MQRIEELIARAAAFDGMTPEQLQLIAGCGRNVHEEAGRYLFREGEPADTFFLIRQGSLALELVGPGAGSVVVETLHEGEIAGWSWLFEPYRWQFDGRVIEPLRAVQFDGACLRGKCEADHELGYELMRRFAGEMTRRLQATRLQMLDVYGDRAHA